MESNKKELLPNNKQAIATCVKLTPYIQQPKNELLKEKDKKWIGKIRIILEKYNSKKQDVPKIFEKKLSMLLERLNAIKESSSYININLISPLVFSIYSDYQKLKKYTQELTDINSKLSKNNKNSREMAELLESGARYKLNSAHPKTIENFCELFVQYVFYIKELNNFNLENLEYEETIIGLQQKILGNKHVDIGNYFDLLLYYSRNQYYSTEILWKGFCTYERVRIYASNNSEIIQEKIINCVKEINDSTSEYTKYLADLIFHLSENNFIEFIKYSIKINLLMNFLEPLYFRGLTLINEIENKKEILCKFKSLFDLLSNVNKITSLVNIIEETKKFKETQILLVKVYGNAIEIINKSLSKSKTIYVRYCLSKFILFLLKNTKLYDLKYSSYFIKLIFYISVAKIDANNDDCIKLQMLRKVYVKEPNIKKIKNIIKILKLLPEQGSALERLQYVIEAFEHKANSNVQIFIINKLLASKLSDDDKKKICFTLAKACKLHYIAGMPHWWKKLGDYNPSVEIYINELKVVGLIVDGKELHEFTKVGFNIPYYIFSSDDYSHLHKDTVSLIFKVFSSIKNDEISNNLDSYKFEFNKTIDALEHLYGFYKDDKYLKYRVKAFEYIKDGLVNYENDSFKKRIEITSEIVKNFTNYHLSHIDNIVANGKVSGEQEILAIFDKAMSRKGRSLEEWQDSTSSIGDKLNFIHAYYKYSEIEFDKDFNSLNPVKPFTFINERNETKKYIETKKNVFEKLGINHFQHNQVATLSVLDNHIKSFDENLFIKLGTGQGKSLVIAESAKRILDARKAKQVFIITCYDHLADRDYNAFKEYYNDFGIKAVLCSKASSTEKLKDAKVIYSDLETYFSVLRNESHKLLTGENIEIYYPEKNDTVLIMDEFDSLILDAEEIYQHVFAFEIDRKNYNIYDSNSLKEMMGSSFIRQCEQLFPDIFNIWFNNIISLKEYENQNQVDRTVEDSLGKKSTFTKSFLTRLETEKKAIFVHHYLSPLCFYQQFKQIIGFSGSIERVGITAFEDIFRPISYYEIPPFFGIEKIKSNRTERERVLISDKEKFFQAIIDEVRKTKASQPILIFADAKIKDNENDSDFEAIKKLLEKEIKSDNNKILLIQSENDIKVNISKIGRLGYITLSTRIMARGADIKIDKNITKGLHLIITYYPENESVYTQMLGRTARQDEVGSYRVIVQKDKISSKNKKIEIDPSNQVLHDCSQRFFKKASQNKKKLRGDLRWPIFSELLYKNQWKYINDNSQEQMNKINTFVDKYILGI